MMGNPYVLPEGNVQIAFSGGRSSAYMLSKILEANGPLPERVVVSFQNTGRESAETLDFVREVSERWGVNITWLEYRVRDNKVGFAVVDHASASREGEPFEALIRKKMYLPHVRARFCTGELKVRTVKRYLVSLGWKKWTCATGFRADEMRRVNKPQQKDRFTRWTPMADAGVTKADVLAFWKHQPFDLELEDEDDGNCDGCFLKSEAAIARLAVRKPARAAWWERLEAVATELTSGDYAQFSSRFSRKEIRIYLENQTEVDFSANGALCQASGGECHA